MQQVQVRNAIQDFSYPEKFEEFLKSKAGTINERTINTYRGCSKQLFKHMQDNNIAVPTVGQMEGWKAIMKDKGLQVATRNLYLTVAQMFFRYMKKHGLKNTAFKVKLLKDKNNLHKRTYVREDWFIKMLEYNGSKTVAQKRNRAILFLKYYNGLRDVSLLGCVRSDFKLMNNGYVLTAINKGHLDKEDFGIEPIVAGAINDYLSALPESIEPGTPLFLSTSYNHYLKPISSVHIRRTIGKLYDKLVKDGTITKDDRERLSAHSLRHGFATYCIEQNVNMRDLQQMLGHAKIETSEIYVHTYNAGKKWDVAQEAFASLTERINNEQAKPPVKSDEGSKEINTNRSRGFVERNRQLYQPDRSRELAPCA